MAASRSPAEVWRGAFEDRIAEDLKRIAAALEAVLAAARLEPAAPDWLFLTGGSSLIPGDPRDVRPQVRR